MVSIDDIKSLDNEELKERIIGLNDLQLKNIKESSLYNILISLNAIKIVSGDNKPNKKYESESERLVEISSSLKDLLLNRDMDKLKSIRKELFDFKSVVDGYLIEMAYVGELIDENGVKILSNKELTSFNPAAVESVVQRVNDELEKSRENYSKYSFIISEIVRLLPMRMVKGNYDEILRSTLARNMGSFTESMVDYTIDNYRKNFDSSLRDGYGTKFDYYFMRIEKIKREDLAKKNLEDLSKLVEEIMELTKELTDLSDYILSLGIITNLLLVLYTIDSRGTIEIGYDEKLSQWEEDYKGDTKTLEKHNRRLGKILEDLDISLQKDLREYELYAIELANREDFQHEELDEDLVHTRSVLAFYNDIQFSDLEYLEKMDINFANRDYIENSIDSLIEYINRATRGMKNLERKIRMRKLLSLIDLPFGNITEFGNYIRYALDPRVSDERVIAFKINQMNYFLDEITDK